MADVIMLFMLNQKSSSFNLTYIWITAQGVQKKDIRKSLNEEPLILNAVRSLVLRANNVHGQHIGVHRHSSTLWNTRKQTILQFNTLETSKNHSEQGIVNFFVYDTNSFFLSSSQKDPSLNLLESIQGSRLSTMIPNM